MDQVNLIKNITEIFGILLILNSIAIILSPKYFSFFNKTYFIEPLTKKGKEEVVNFINTKDYFGQRFISSILCAVLGVYGIVWAQGWVESVSFLRIAIVLFIIIGVSKIIKK